MSLYVIFVWKGILFYMVVLFYMVFVVDLCSKIVKEKFHIDEYAILYAVLMKEVLG